MQTYSEFELVQSAPDDWHAVRDEGFRRQDVASKKIEKLEQQLAKAKAEHASAQRIITAAMKAAN